MSEAERSSVKASRAARAAFICAASTSVAATSTGLEPQAGCELHVRLPSLTPEWTNVYAPCQPTASHLLLRPLAACKLSTPQWKCGADRWRSFVCVARTAVGPLGSSRCCAQVTRASSSVPLRCGGSSSTFASRPQSLHGAWITIDRRYLRHPCGRDGVTVTHA